MAKSSSRTATRSALGYSLSGFQSFQAGRLTRFNEPRETIQLRDSSRRFHCFWPRKFDVSSIVHKNGSMKHPHSIGRTSLLGIVVALLVWPAAVRSAELPDQALVISRGPYLQMATPNSICVVWRTLWKNIDAAVHYGAERDHLDKVARGDAVVVRTALGGIYDLTPRVQALRTRANLGLARLSGAPVGTFQYEVQLSGLSPDTQYYYALYDGETRLTPADDSYHFQTNPQPGVSHPLRFAVLGDSGTARNAQLQVYRALVAREANERHPCDLWLHVGDMAYTRGRDAQFRTRFFRVYEPTLRHTVCWPTFANHEGYSSSSITGVGPYFDAYVAPTEGEAGGTPSGTEAFYSFDYGDVHFISLESFEVRNKATDTMANWLKTDLAQAQAQRAQWCIAFFHHAPYTKGSHDSDKEKELIEMRAVFMPILEAGGVDLVLSGHSHIYERSMLVDGAYATNTTSANVVLDDGDGNPAGDGPYRKSAGLNPHQGTVLVVAGHGGGRLGRKGTCPLMKRTIYPEHGSVIVDINGDTLTGIMLNARGQERDRFSLVKRGTVSPVRLAKPWQPPPNPKGGYPPQKDWLSMLPVDYTVLIPAHASWQYLAGSRPASDRWTHLDFDAAGWKNGAAGFGYKYPQARTRLNDMRNQYQVIYLRHTFVVEKADLITELGLMMDYDDGFIAYLNGHEILRKNVGNGRGEKAKDVKGHTAHGLTFYALQDSYKYLKNGTNVLAIEGHNTSLNSSDLLIDPYLVSEP